MRVKICVIPSLSIHNQFEVIFKIFMGNVKYCEEDTYRPLPLRYVSTVWGILINLLPHKTDVLRGRIKEGAERADLMGKSE